VNHYLTLIDKNFKNYISHLEKKKKKEKKEERRMSYILYYPLFRIDDTK
jgi:hypothetical protein